MTLKLSIGEIDISTSDGVKYANQLKESRLTVAKEMKAALKCTTAADKKRLVQRWQTDYSPIMAAQLLDMARSKHAKEFARWGEK